MAKDEKSVAVAAVAVVLVVVVVSSGTVESVAQVGRRTVEWWCRSRL